jgi:hypothetical protein
MRFPHGQAGRHGPCWIRTSDLGIKSLDFVLTTSVGRRPRVTSGAGFSRVAQLARDVAYRRMARRSFAIWFAPDRSRWPRRQAAAPVRELVGADPRSAGSPPIETGRPERSGSSGLAAQALWRQPLQEPPGTRATPTRLRLCERWSSRRACTDCSPQIGGNGRNLQGRGGADRGLRSAAPIRVLARAHRTASDARSGRPMRSRDAWEPVPRRESPPPQRALAVSTRFRIRRCSLRRTGLDRAARSGLLWACRSGGGYRRGRAGRSRFRRSARSALR